MRKKLVILIGIIIVIIILFGLVKQISEALSAGDRLEKASFDLLKLQEENNSLKKKLSATEDSSFLEEQARNKLNMARENETVVIISEKQVKEIIEAQKPKKIVQFPNWQGWLRLFTH